MKPGDLPYFLEIEKIASRLNRIVGLSPIIFLPMSITNCRKYWGLAYFEDDRIYLSLRRRHPTRWGNLNLAYQMTDTICHELVHFKLMNPLHDTAFLKCHAKYLALACKHGIHRAVEKAVARASRL